MSKWPRCSILIPTWNNLAYLQLCIRSIQQHSAVAHEVLVFVNEGTDGTIDWLRDEGITYLLSPTNQGVCAALNRLATEASTDYLLYLNDDMYVLPGWDIHLLSAALQRPDHRWYLSATLLEPKRTGNPCVIAPADFGSDPSQFREKALLAEFAQFSFADWSGASWPPSLMHRQLWDEVGGYTEAYFPGNYSDPDLSMKIWKTGVRWFQGIGSARVYHFGSKTTGRSPMNDGRTTFARRWGMMPSYFKKHYLRLGQPFTGALREPRHGLGYWMSRWRAQRLSAKGGE